MRLNVSIMGDTSPTKHIHLLDGLRGVAALSVVIFHFTEWIYTDFSKNFVGHGFLAVDFFYCLSGFVIAYAYDHRFPQLGNWAFFKRRLIRLHPLVVLGGILGILAFLFDPFANNIQQYPLWQIILLSLATLLLIPYPVMADRSFNLFGLNAPAWTLFWEYVANICYCLVLVRLGKRALYVLIVLAAILLATVAYEAGNLLGGWNAETFWHGGVRVAYSFLAGLLIYRNKWTIPNRLGFPALALLLLVAMTMPYFSFNWLVELLIVLCYFPLIVSLGAGSVNQQSTEKLCRFSGRISYPLYITHYFVIWIFGNWFLQTEPDRLTLVSVVVLTTLLLVGVAYLSLRFYDEPLRRYLTKKS